MKQQSLLTLILGFGGFVWFGFGFFSVFSPLLHLWYLNVLQIRVTVLEGNGGKNYMISTTSKHTPEQRQAFRELSFRMPIASSGFGWLIHLWTGLVLKGDFQVRLDKFSCTV